MIYCTTAHEIWYTLHQIFLACSLAKVMKYKAKLHNLKKGGMSPKDYFSKVKQRIDALASAGKFIYDEDHVLPIIEGLGNAYESIIAVISATSSS